MVRLGRESFKRFMKTILGQILPHIEGYSPPERALLIEFFSILQHYEEAEHQRERLS
ncbi:MAG: hypothetical protein ACFFDT_13360 [Candidatus Hodarchaeota archaeon]